VKRIALLAVLALSALGVTACVNEPHFRCHGTTGVYFTGSRRGGVDAVPNHPRCKADER
jgi:hypothetical protein